ncbi:MAG: ABC transporter substrate-binding protein [Stappia sp.]|uniref:MCE family protein n=1 Tax=Stappia sp. TaxID=1870903 RepID=UPI000C5AF8FA|nr:MCE family protein [Stappia sp.]MAA97502.1 ABC transporter substrate-binding protein [Stappia sp.]MBM22035.1 ABC transporter substrate-binding protein [Stappia sp.]
METRANYVVIGAFVFITLIVGFVFIYWLGSRADGPRALPVKVVFTSAVTGLSVGGAVNFNGIKVGDVGELGFDPTDPSVVIATIRVNPTTPLREDVKATLGFQTLSGIAYVDLKGGSSNAPLLLDPDDDEPPVIYAEKSAFEDIVEGARDILTRADKTLASVEQVVSDNREEINQIVHNARVFSDALAKNADGVDTFMSSVAATGDALTKLSGKLEGLVESATRIVDAVPADKVRQIVDDASTVTSKVASAADGLTGLIDDAEKAAEDLQAFASGLGGSLAKVDKVISAVDPQSINDVVDGAASFARMLKDRSPDINRLVTSSSTTMANVETITQTVADRREEIGKIISEVQQLSAELNAVVAAIDPEQVRTIVASVEEVSSGLAGRTQTVTRAIDQAGEAMANVNEFSQSLKGRGPEIDQIVSDARELASKLNATGTRIQSVVDKVDAMVDGDGEGFVKEATEAAASIRRVADILAERVGPITAGLQRFTSRGSADFSDAMSQLNRTLVEIQRTVSSINRDPQRVIFGGSDKPTFNGAQRR